MTSIDPVARVARPRRRTVLGVVCLIVALATLYVTVIALYASGSEVVSRGNDTVPPGAISLALTPEKMDASTDRLTVSLLPKQADGGEYTDGVVVDKPFYVLVSAAAGSTVARYDPSALVAPSEVSFVMDGAIE